MTHTWISVDAEDLAQEVFLRFWQHRDRLQAGADVGAFLRAITKRVLNEQGRRKEFSALPEPERLADSGGPEFDGLSGPEAVMEEAHWDAVLYEQIYDGLLTAREAWVFMAVAMYDYSVAETAVELECSPESVRQTLYRARKRLRQLASHFSREDR